MVTEEMNREAAVAAKEGETASAPTVDSLADGRTEVASGDATPEAPTPEYEEGASLEESGNGDAEAGVEAEASAEAETDIEASEDASVSDVGDTERLLSLASADYDALCESFPAARAYPSLAAMPGAERFSELRELGLSVGEAARAAMPEVSAVMSREASRDARVASMPNRSEASRGGMSYGEMAAARELFSGLSTKELLSLYRRVNQ